MRLRFSGIRLTTITAYFFAFLSLANSQPASVNGITDTAPNRSGLQLLQRKMQSYVDDGKVAGLVTLIARRGQIVHFEEYGMRDIEHKRPMRKNTIFRMASMTKPFTSTAVMMLVERDRLKLDDPVEKYIPAFAETRVFSNGELVPPAHSITIKDLLMHTSGITASRFGNSPVNRIYAESDLGSSETLEEFITRLAKLPLLHQPGAAWSYGLSTDILARVVEIVTGEPFGEYIEETILQPLGMRDSGFTLPSEKADRLATVYAMRVSRGLQRLDAPITAKFPRGNTGMVSTVTDYLRFAQMLLNGGELDGARLLKPETVELMTRNHLPEHLIPIGVLNFAFERTGFGLGFSVVVGEAPKRSSSAGNGFWWNRSAPPVGAYGWLGAYMTYFWIDPAHQIIGILMAQSTDAMKMRIMQEFHTLTYQALDSALSTH